MTKVKQRLYYQTTNIGFWGIIALISLLPMILSRFGLGLYLVPQTEIVVTFFLSIYCNKKSWQYFIYGLFVDGILGSPLGVSSFILLLLHYIISKYKSNLSKQNIFTILVYYLYTIIAVIILKHILFSLYYGSKITPYYSEIFINMLINIIFYPILHLLLSKIMYFKNHENQQ